MWEKDYGLSVSPASTHAVFHCYATPLDKDKLNHTTIITFSEFRDCLIMDRPLRWVKDPDKRLSVKELLNAPLESFVEHEISERMKLRFCLLIQKCCSPD
jgi:hypothetical protein